MAKAIACRMTSLSKKEEENAASRRGGGKGEGEAITPNKMRSQ